MWLGDGLDACNSRGTCFDMAKEDVLPCIEHGLVDVEFVMSGDKELAFCSVDLVEVGSAHPGPRFVGIRVTGKRRRMR